MKICGTLNLIRYRLFFVLAVLGAVSFTWQSTAQGFGFQEPARNLTPRQREIQKQEQRLNSTETEERRDALMRLGTIRHADASRAALAGLRDVSPIVRATAVNAILSLPPEESVPALIPLLSDKEEFVRQEAAYALGRTRSRAAVDSLGERLLTDKKDGVRAAAAVALGHIGDAGGVPYLIQAISRSASTTEGKTKRKLKAEKNEFVLRAAVVSLGQIRSRAAVSALLGLLADEKLHSDIRRESAVSLGLIGDPAAIPALETTASNIDPYLSRAAAEAVRRISRSRQ
jgi:HEAT repeat protein